MVTKHASPIAAAIGACIVGSLSVGTANAAANPFGLAELDSGYMQLAMTKKPVEGTGGDDKAMAEGKCGEGKCGAGKSTAEGKCGGADKAMAEGKCGGAGKAMAEGKCCEGKCGANK